MPGRAATALSAWRGRPHAPVWVEGDGGTIWSERHPAVDGDAWVGREVYRDPDHQPHGRRPCHPVPGGPRCGTMTGEGPPSRRMSMAWQLEGTYFENCSCDMVCPCTTSGLTMPADQDRCRVVLAFHVDQGEVEGVDVSDKTVVVVADTPPLMS